MTKLLCIACLFVCFTSCKQNNKKASEKKEAVTDSSAFFPVNDIIIADIKDVQATPYFVYKITASKNKKRDSVVLMPQQFTQMAGIFLKKDITKPEFKKLYKESSFHDLSTKSYTLNYSSMDTTVDVNDVTVLFNNETGKAKNIFIRSNKANADSSVREFYSWTVGRKFQINRSVHRKDNSETEESITVFWNDVKP
jgi:hypothetical protein